MKSDRQNMNMGMFPFIPNNMMFPNYMNDNYNNIDGRFNNIEKRLKQLENKVQRLENPYGNNLDNNTYQNTQNYNGEMYMM